MLTHQPAPPVTQIQQQQASQQASKKQKTVNDAITSSLSSSMNMKRGRNDDGASSEASSSDDSDADTSFKNRIVAPGSKRRHKGVHKRARLSMTSVEASPIEMTVKKRVTFDDKHYGRKIDQSFEVCCVIHSDVSKEIHFANVKSDHWREEAFA